MPSLPNRLSWPVGIIRATLKAGSFPLLCTEMWRGVENVRRALSDWMCFMHMVPAGTKAELDRYIGYWQPYATSHSALDDDESMQHESPTLL